MTLEFRAGASANAVANALTDYLVHDTGNLALTGGSSGIAVLRELRANASSIPWSHWQLWWGDERFLDSGDPERNDVQAYEALLNFLIESRLLDPLHVHRWLDPHHVAGDAPACAADYAGRLSACPQGMDLVLLGVGPDGHVASLFPGAPFGTSTQRTLAVFHSPKPPAVRTSFTMDEICRAREVWLFAFGAQKRPVAQALLDGSDMTLPAMHARGRERTVIWID